MVDSEVDHLLRMGDDLKSRIGLRPRTLLLCHGEGQCHHDNNSDNHNDEDDDDPAAS
jgi:hypothetical protein